MKTFKRIMLTVLAVLPAVYTSVAMFFLPDTIAAHFGFDGKVDRYGSKYEALIFPGIILLCYIIYFLVRKYTEKSSTDDDATARNMDVSDTIMTAMFVLFNSLCAVLLFAMVNPDSMSGGGIFPIILSSMIGIIFIVIGNIMPKTKRNSFLGMRMPFNMDTDEHWYIANRASGIALIFVGLVTAVSGIIVRNISFIIYMLISIVVFSGIAIIYSYVKIKREK